MSESLFYNRDQNISGITIPASFSALNLTPVYGSTVEFTANNHSYPTDDFYYNLIPMSVDSLTAKFGLKYDVNESNAQKLAVFFEAQSGNNSFKFAPDNSNILAILNSSSSNLFLSYGLEFKLVSFKNKSNLSFKVSLSFNLFLRSTESK